MDTSRRYSLLLFVVLAGALTVTSSPAQTCYRLRPEPLIHNFALVIDRSGSMQGQPLAQAAAGARLFVEQMQANDRAAIIAFSNKVHLAAGMTTNRHRLKQAIAGLSASGATALYDAIVRAASTVLARDGTHIIVFLTDGTDTGSLYKLGDIRSLGLSEGIFIYGIGLGNVDATALAELTRATGGRLLTTPRPDQLGDLYARVLREYYDTFAARMPEHGAYAIRSLPAGREVRMDGENRGRTPLKLDNVTPGEHAIEVVFGRGVWSCTAPARSGYRTLIDAREDDLGHDLWISTRPHEAVVFLDNAYVGTTSLGIVRPEQPGWGDAVKQDPDQLRIPLVPKGTHVLRLVAMPDFDFGPEQEFQFEFDLGGKERVLQVDILTRRVRVDDGTELRQSPQDRMDEQMKQFDDELDMGGDPFEDL